MKMNKKIIMGTGVFFVILISVIVSNNLTFDNETKITYQKQIKLGYCPTMVNYAKEFESENLATITNYGSTIQAINALKIGDVDAIIVGRLATKNELDKPFSYLFREGLTLVGLTKKFIDSKDLETLEIHTYLNKITAETFLPESKNIIFHDNLNSAFENGITKSVLINWSDYNDNLNLIVPMELSKKVEKFRLPVFYTFSEETFNNFKR